MRSGKLYDSLGQGTGAELVNFPNDEKVIDLTCAAQFMVALTEAGNVYYWGKMQVSKLVGANMYSVLPKIVQGGPPLGLFYHRSHNASVCY